MIMVGKIVLSYISRVYASDPPNLDFKHDGSYIYITDDLGGEAQIKLEGDIARIIGINSVPRSKKYSPEEDNFKKRGFFRGVLKSLKNHGINTIKINLQSHDSRAALKRLVETGDLENPRDDMGISVDRYPTTFDIR